MNAPLVRIAIKPSRSIFGGRRQWKFEIRGGNGERIDPRDTYNNRDDAEKIMLEVFTGAYPVELVLYDRDGHVESRRELLR